MKKIVTVNEFSEEDQKKYKKLAKANDLGIKIVFKKKYMVEKAYIPDENEKMSETDDDAQEQDPPAGEDGRTKSKGPKKGSSLAELDTWYLVCDSKKDQEDCLEALVISAKAINSKYVQDP